MRTPTWRLSTLLLGSGCCALVYQTTWIREFRLIFGASTAASAAVLAIFIGGLGLGGWLLGRRADAHPRPILFYAQLETIVAISAALTPLLLMLVRELYVYLGGAPRLGLVVGTVGRLLLSGLVLAIPTVAMGGTLPAAARGATAGNDVRRQHVAALYALNSLGAVVGCIVSTFFLLEALGNHQTLWLAAAVNLLIAMFARQLDRATEPPADVTVAEPERHEAHAPASFVLLASGVVGFAFFLMELVWYRMLGPLLGGTVFTFSLILALALVGIGLGGLVYALAGSKRAPSLRGFAWTCLLEACAMAGAFALGDRLALLALVLQPLGRAAFAAEVLGWSVVSAVVVLPAAIIAGYQFPMLIALLGSGRKQVGRQIGLAYATNTIGAIVGSLAGGFGLLPWLSAPGAWRFATVSLVVLGAAAVVLSASRRSLRTFAGQTALAMATVALLAATGPTAIWRHTGIGAGRATMTSITSANQLKAWDHAERRAVVWDGDGTESSVALKKASTGYAFFVNGKSDGSARGDAGTQVMMGLLGPILRSQPTKRSLVIGLGTGSTAGWLGAIPAMERVDVVELEPLILDVARACRDVNHNVLENPKVHITIGDAREALLTSKDSYDVIASEPSNPFRAGIASLFTREYYHAASNRLTPDGVFVQWVQAYEIDSRTLRTIYGTMASEFPYVETWETTVNDLVLIGSKRPLVHRTGELAARIAEEPFKTALGNAWRVSDVNGLFAHYLANDTLARAIAAAPNVDLNTDDRNVVEFGLARSVGVNAPALATSLRQVAKSLHADRPPLDHPELVDWAKVDTSWVGFQVFEATVINVLTVVPTDQHEQSRREALVRYYQNDNTPAAREALGGQSLEPRDPIDLAMLADVAAQTGDDAAALPLIEQLRAFNTGEGDTVLATLRMQEKRYDEAAPLLEHAFAEYQKSPWAILKYKQRALELAENLGSHNPAMARRMFDALGSPFSAAALDEQRNLTRTALAQSADFKGLCREAIRPLEAHVPWTAGFLAARRECYKASGDNLMARATQDALDFVSHEPLPLESGLRGGAVAQAAR